MYLNAPYQSSFYYGWFIAKQITSQPVLNQKFNFRKKP